MQYKLGLEIPEKNIRPGNIVWISLWSPKNIEKAPEGEKWLIEIKGVEEPIEPKSPYTYSVLGKEEIHEGDFGICWFYEAIPA